MFGSKSFDSPFSLEEIWKWFQQ